MSTGIVAKVLGCNGGATHVLLAPGSDPAGLFQTGWPDHHPDHGRHHGRIYQANGERNYIEFGRYQPVQTRSTNALYAWSTITELSPSATKFQGCLGRSFSSAEMADELAESVYSGKDGVEEDSALHTCLWKDSDEESAIQGPT